MTKEDKTTKIVISIVGKHEDLVELEANIAAHAEAASHDYSVVITIESYTFDAPR